MPCFEFLSKASCFFLKFRIYYRRSLRAFPPHADLHKKTLSMKGPNDDHCRQRPANLPLVDRQGPVGARNTHWPRLFSPVRKPVYDALFNLPHTNFPGHVFRVGFGPARRFFYFHKTGELCPGARFLPPVATPHGRTLFVFGNFGERTRARTPTQSGNSDSDADSDRRQDWPRAR